MTSALFVFNTMYIYLESQNKCLNDQTEKERYNSVPVEGRCNLDASYIHILPAFYYLWSLEVFISNLYIEYKVYTI